MSTPVAVWLEHVSARRRVGVKGPRAAALLTELGVTVPKSPNSWSPLRPADRDDSPNIVARLGSTEFLVEEADADICNTIEARCLAGAPGARLGLREDIEFQLGGDAAPAALAEVCNVNFAALAPGKPVYLTLMIGVGVLVLPQQRDDGRIFRIWCDPTFGSYLQEALEAVVNRIQSGRAS